MLAAATHPLIVRVHTRFCETARGAFLHHQRRVVSKTIQQHRYRFVGRDNGEAVDSSSAGPHIRVVQIRSNDFSDVIWLYASIRQCSQRPQRPPSLVRVPYREFQTIQTRLVS